VIHDKGRGGDGNHTRPKRALCLHDVVNENGDGEEDEGEDEDDGEESVRGSWEQETETN
jgi:hypothetical protein